MTTTTRALTRADTPVRTRTTGREYLRVSADRSGTQRSPDQQHKENGRAAARLGLTLGTPYREAGAVSASTFSTKTRDAFDRLMADLESGAFGADLLILWESSRGSRRTGEWCDLIDACAKADVHVMVTSQGGKVYDPKNGRDRRSLQEDAVDAEYESSKISDRAKRSAMDNAEIGKPHGPAPFGYRRVYDARRQYAGQVPDEVTGPLVGELFMDFLASRNLGAIARDWQARGITNGKGNPFSAVQLRTMLENPAYCGTRVWLPGSGNNRNARNARGTRTTGAWEGIVSVATFDAVAAILADPTRQTTRPGRGVHLVSMIGVCGVCGAPVAWAGKDGGIYRCHGYRNQAGGCVAVRAAELDDLAEMLIVSYLTRADNAAALKGAQDEASGNAALTAARARLAALRARQDALGVLMADAGAELAPLVAAARVVGDDIASAEAEVRELATPDDLRGLVDPGDAAHVEAQWHAADMTVKREIARRLFVPGRIGTLRVLPRTARGPVRTPITERITLDRG